MKRHQHQRSVEVCVSPDGAIQIDAVGFKGSDCEAATKFLEDALGIAGQRQRKPEYHQRVKAESQQNVGSQ